MEGQIELENSTCPKPRYGTRPLIFDRGDVIPKPKRSQNPMKERFKLRHSDLASLSPNQAKIRKQSKNGRLLPTLYCVCGFTDPTKCNRREKDDKPTNELRDDLKSVLTKLDKQLIKQLHKLGELRFGEPLGDRIITFYLIITFNLKLY